MADQDFSALLSTAPDAAPAPQPQAAKAPAGNDFSALLSVAPDAPTKDSGDGLFDSLIHQESRGKQFNANGAPLTSKAGAIGVAQVMPGTAKEAAELAGVPYDDMRYRTDAEYNKSLGRAYLTKQLVDFQDQAKALAAYNAGPGAVRNAIAQAEKNGNPAGWLNYLPAETRAYVPAILNRSSKAAAQPGQNEHSNTYSAPVQKATAGDYLKELGASAVDSIGYIGQAAGEGAAWLANKVTGTEDYEGKNLLKPASDAIRNTMTDGGKQARQEASIEGSVVDLLSGDAKLPATGQGWGMMAANGFGSLATMFVPIIGPASSVAKLTKAAEVASAAGKTAEAAELLAQAKRASYAAKGFGAGVEGATTGGAAAGDVRDTAAKTIAGMSHEELMQQVPVYAEAFNQYGNEQQARQAVVNSAARWAGGLSAIAGAAGGAFNAKLIEDTLVHKGISSMVGNSTGSRLGRTAIGAAGGSLAEGLQETGEKVGQNMGENIALGRDASDNVLRDTAGDFLGGAIVGGPIGGVGGAVSRPTVKPELKPVADKASEQNSPLSKAAMAGVTATEQLQQNTVQQPPVDPVARLAELEAIGKDKPDQQVTDESGNPITVPGERGRYFTPEEKAEYDHLKGLRDSTPGMSTEDQKASQPQVDDILDRAKAIEDATRTNNGLSAFRQEDSPVNVKQFLNDLAIAKSKSTNAATREQALSRLEFAADWAGLNVGQAPARQSNEVAGPPTRTEHTIGMATDAGLSQQERSDVIAAMATWRNPNLPAATRQAALSQAMEIIGRRKAASMPTQESGKPAAVLGDIPGTEGHFLREAERLENGAYQFLELGFDQEAQELKDQADSMREKAASARAGELGMELSAEETPDNSSPASQQTVEQATQGLPRVQIPALADGEKPTADNTAARRKRAAQVAQLAGIGFETVERRGKEFFLINAKTGQEVKLEGMADAQMARAAIAKVVNDRAHTAAASPNNDRLEPTQAQINAGNYKKSDVIDLNGMKIVIENPAGSTRRGVSPDGKAWESKMNHHYGEFLGTEGADGDRLDVFIGNRPDSNKVFVIDQVNPDGSFDEHKVVMGVTSEDQARDTYLSNYEKGWTGLGAITEMSLDDFRAWAKSERAKQPLMLGKQDKLFTVTDKGVPVTLMALDPSEVGDASAQRAGKGKFISKKDADLIKAVGAVFGVNVQFFRPVTPGFSADGFFNGGNTLYLNERTTISPLAVFGHEFMHRIKSLNPKAYASIAKVVAANVKDPKGYRADYFGAEYAEQHGNEPLTDAELEELVSDLHGNLMTDSKFWGDVFRQIAKDHGAESKSLIAQLSASLSKMIDALINSLKGKNFNAGQFVNNMKDVRAAFKDGLVEYMNQVGIMKTGMQAEILRAEQKAKDADVKRSTPKPTDGLTLEAYHFSQQPREVLSTGMFGTGLKGSGRDEILANPDKRVKQRLSFYVDKGTGIRPEAGVGGIAHKATLTNIYDADADKLRLKSGDARAFESKVLDAGYSGYLSRMDGTQPGQVILLGEQTIKPEVLGPRTSIEGAKTVPVAAAREMDLGDKITSNKTLPSGQATPARWAELLMQHMPAEAAQLMDIAALGNEPIYKDELVAKIRKLQPQIKKSVERAQDEYAAVEAKYKGTDAWMKAPSGKPTLLNERQWVQVRTPSFQKWFGPWEKYAAEGKNVWYDEDGEVSKVVDDNGEPLVVYHGSGKGGFMEFERPGGTKRGDLGIFTTSDLGMAESYVRRNRARRVAEPEDSTYPQAGDQPGVYALFLNIRGPYEAHFEGANWDGGRPEQFVIYDEDGEQLYSPDGKGYFDEDELDKELARLDAEDISAKAEPAPDHYETTDSVIKDARRHKGHDGAFIHQVRDDGGGTGYSGDPADVFVAFEPNQLKSADFNNGEFSDSTGDIRKSEQRQYKLDIEREGRVKGRSVRFSPEETAAFEKAAKDLNLTKPQTRALLEKAKDVKRQYPKAEGWAPIELIGIESKKDDDGNAIPGTEEPKFATIGYAFNVPPGAKRAPNKHDEKLAKQVATKFEQLIQDIYDRAKDGDKNAQVIIGHQTWYRNVAEVLRREYGASGDLLADLLGATSPNTPVDTNWRFSIDIMRRFVRGDFNAELQKFSDFLELGGDASKYPAADKIRQVSGKLYGMNSTNAMKALVDMWRVIEPGQAPKARNFALNLIGQSNMATIDVWAARMLRRAANMIRGMDLPRIPPAAETGVSGNWNAGATGVGGEFGFGAKVLDMVSKSLEKRGIKVSPPDLQAIAWFAEKELWGQKGWTTKTGEGGSFEENIEATPVERYIAGWSIQQGTKVPETGPVSVAQARVLSMLKGDDSVIAARVMPTSGLYGGVVEASFDTEWTALKGKHDPSMAMAEIARLAQENSQLDIFVSRVVAPSEDNPNARPGVEIYFKTTKDFQAALPMLKKFTERGQDGFTMAVDPRAKPKGVTGESFIGVRLQYVPEISMRWDEGLRRKLLAPGGIERVLKGKFQLLNDIAAEVGQMDGVAFASAQKYDTVVVGKENYDEYIDRAAEGRDSKAGSKVWFGQPIRQGLEGAVARLRGDGRKDGRGSVQNAGSEFLASPARGSGDESVREQGGLRRSPGRVSGEGRSDQGYEGREKDGSLKGLPREFTVAGQKLKASHWHPAEQVARRYMADAGLEYNPPANFATVDPERAKRIAAEYDALKHDPQNPEVKAAYAALARETAAQYKAVIDSGLQVEFIDFAKQGDPYEASPRLATEDVRNNNHMWVFSTRDGFGTDTSFDPAENPLLEETEFTISGQKALVNDLFRVVHDYFGHVKEGVGFRANGEENTWRAHSAMFSPLAQRALTTETRGQNSWLNFGPYGESNRSAKVGDTHFADQKTGLLPLWASEEGRHDDPVYRDEIDPKAAVGRQVIQEVEIEETGKTGKLSVDGGNTLADYNQRIDAMKQLLGCLKK